MDRGTGSMPTKPESRMAVTSGSCRCPVGVYRGRRIKGIERSFFPFWKICLPQGDGAVIGKTVKRACLITIVLTSFLATSCLVQGKQEKPASARESVGGAWLYTVLEPDAIPSIDRPKFVPAAKGEEFMAPEEPVIGLIGPKGTPRAYSTWLLDHHEIVNDRIDGKPVAVTW